MHISYPFSIDERGKVRVANTPRKVWVDRVRAVVSTQLGTRAMRPEFGLDTHSSVLNSGTPAERDIEALIKEAFAKYLPSLAVVRAQARLLPDSSVMEVDLVFTSPDSTQIESTVLVGDGPVSLNSTD